jgi:hypothetical protein
VRSQYDAAWRVHQFIDSSCELARQTAGHGWLGTRSQAPEERHRRNVQPPGAHVPLRRRGQRVQPGA